MVNVAVFAVAMFFFNELPTQGFPAISKSEVKSEEHEEKSRARTRLQ